jgi:ligand-binding sensor domain-containing protein
MSRVALTDKNNTLWIGTDNGIAVMKGEKMEIVKRFITWRINGLFVAEKRLKELLKADTKPGASDKELDGLYKMISIQLKAISDMQNEIITLQLIDEENQK